MEQKQETVVTGVEDKVIKVAMQVFGESIMKYLGQGGKVKRIGPSNKTKYLSFKLNIIKNDPHQNNNSPK